MSLREPPVIPPARFADSLMSQTGIVLKNKRGRLAHQSNAPRSNVTHSFSVRQPALASVRERWRNAAINFSTFQAGMLLKNKGAKRRSREASEDVAENKRDGSISGDITENKGLASYRLAQSGALRPTVTHSFTVRQPAFAGVLDRGRKTVINFSTFQAGMLLKNKGANRRSRDASGDIAENKRDSSISGDMSENKGLAVRSDMAALGFCYRGGFRPPDGRGTPWRAPTSIVD